VEIEDAASDAGNAEHDAKAPCFSLQAVARVPMAGTMQIVVALGVASLVALLDSGSTDNFISEEVARRSGLPLRQRPRLTALVAERGSCVGIIRGTPLLIDGDAFPTDLYVMPLAGYNVVLGTLWLGELGPIVWDPISWTGVASPSVTALGTTTEVDPLLEASLLSFGGSSRTSSVCPPSVRTTTTLFSCLTASRSSSALTGTPQRTRTS
jgi:hypothetical protein